MNKAPPGKFTIGDIAKLASPSGEVSQGQFAGLVHNGLLTPDGGGGKIGRANHYPFRELVVGRFAAWLSANGMDLDALRVLLPQLRSADMGRFLDSLEQFVGGNWPFSAAEMAKLDEGYWPEDWRLQFRVWVLFFGEGGAAVHLATEAPRMPVTGVLELSLCDVYRPLLPPDRRPKDPYRDGDAE